MSYSVAFKCTYNNGSESVFVGFADTCSEDNIKRNVKSNRVWCSSPLCECRKYYDGGMDGDKPVAPCYESELFQRWRFGAGDFHTGVKAGQPIHLTRTEEGKFALLTTRLPNEDESKRRIIGLFQIAKVENQNTVIAASKGRVRLPLEEAKELYFWAYCTNKAKKPAWGTGLFRYLEDGQVHRILADVASTVRDENTKAEIDYLVSQAFGNKPAPPASGCLPEKSINRLIALAKIRKYGLGGEGNAHKELKEWISKHPEVLDLADTTGVTVERTFISGDSADLVFTHQSGDYTVIEVETTTPLPGAYQAIKYKALLCAEKGLPLDTNKVKPLLVAWSIPSEVQAFCKRYGVEWREYSLSAK
jgi:hypothetical protein